MIVSYTGMVTVCSVSRGCPFLVCSAALGGDKFCIFKFRENRRSTAEGIALCIVDTISVLVHEAKLFISNYQEWSTVYHLRCHIWRPAENPRFSKALSHATGQSPTHLKEISENHQPS